MAPMNYNTLSYKTPSSDQPGYIALSNISQAEPSPKENGSQPLSNIRRRGSKIVSVLRALTNNSASATREEPPSTIRSKISLSYITGQLEHTIVHRSQNKSHLSIFSVAPEFANDENSKTKSESSSDQSLLHNLREPTSEISIGLKYSTKTSRQTSPGSDPLTTIQETNATNNSTGSWPTIQTVEQVAATKIFFEIHYNKLTSIEPTSRSLRLRHLKEELFENSALNNAQKDEKHQAFYKKETDHLRELRVMKAARSQGAKEIVASKYEVVRVLGKGSFGVVRLVREKSSDITDTRKEVYAMKVIKKSDMLRNSQEGHLRAERDFLVAAEGSRWVVPLRASFQDLNYLYLVMDYMPGGDFLGLLIRDNILPEPVAKWYVAEMILCIEEAHALRWIHRDIKPDNFLISASGHLKISDFGLAFDGHWSHDQSYFNNHRYSILSKLGINVEGDALDKYDARSVAAVVNTLTTTSLRRDRHEQTSSNFSQTEGLLNWRNRNGNRTLARSVVGTSQYMAPEVIRGEQYDARCDWWSVAIILYECLYGHTPFLAEEGGRHATKMNIVNHQETFAFPQWPVVSRKCQDLIRSIIRAKDDRLCSKRYRRSHMSHPSQRNKDYSGRYVYAHDAEDIKCHKFFRGIDWQHLHLMNPPFVPNIRSTEDTHYFDEEDPISDFSESTLGPSPTIENIADALKPFKPSIQLLAAEFIEKPHNSIIFRRFEKQIQNLDISDEQKTYLKEFGRLYGPKERKRPRDKLLRDLETAPKVLELRKRGAFLGYTYRRIRVQKSFSTLHGGGDRFTSGTVKVVDGRGAKKL